MTRYNDPAFPYPAGSGHMPGLTARDYFAAAALTGLAKTDTTCTPAEIAAEAYAIADAMVDARYGQASGGPKQ